MTSETKQGRAITNPSEEIALFAQSVQDTTTELIQQLKNEPESAASVETRLNHSFQKGSDALFVALLISASASTDTEEFCQQSREEAVKHRNPLKAPILKKVTLTLLGGLSIIVQAFYLPPDAETRKKRFGEESKGSGLYPQLARYGFGKASSPALISLVARQAVASSSFEQASVELKRRGIDLSEKQVRTQTYQMGNGLLSLRKEQIEQWRDGRVPAGEQLAGKKVIVSADGGRTRHRVSLPKATDAPPNTYPKYSAVWREPKLLTIYTVDEKGKKEQGEPFWIDGTYEGPDHMAEIIACKLHMLGAAKADHVGFTADGAEWFWNRLEWIKKKVGLKEEKTSLILDFWHAAGYLSDALKHFEWKEEGQRQQKYRELRKELHEGKWSEVVQTLRRLVLANKLDKEHEIWGSIRYLEFHGKEGFLKYEEYKKKGLPLGSGAIESTIRRTVNLRMKGNGIFWGSKGSEMFLHLRSLVLSEQWDEKVVEVQKRWQKTRAEDWKWEATKVLENRDSDTLRKRKLKYKIDIEGVSDP